MRTEKKDQNHIVKRMPTLAEASENVLTNLPLLVCAMVLTLALVHDWTM